MALLVDLSLLAVATWLLARVVGLAGLPPLLGMIFAGTVVAGLDLGAQFTGPRLEEYSSPIRVVIPTVLLLRAGMGLSLTELRRLGTLGMRLGFIPLLADAAVLWAASIWLLDLQPLVAAVLAFLVAALSPAIVLPGLLALIDARPRGGRSRRLLNALLVGAPLDNVLALVLMGVALDAAMAGNSNFASLFPVLLWKVGVGLAVGVAAGTLLARVVRDRLQGLGPTALLSLLLVAAGAVLWAGLTWRFSFILAHVAMGVSFRHVAPQLRDALDAGLRRAWDMAQYALFGLIGAALDVEAVMAAGLAVGAVVLLGQLGRFAGSYVATMNAGLRPAERMACALAYVPKATIQAAFAALPLDRVLAASGPTSLSQGDAELILCAGVLAVVITAPIGALTLNRGVDRLLPAEESQGQ
jgi:solute carrier family 9B (sodium/hydrogen exchanger), member 1/2